MSKNKNVISSKPSKPLKIPAYDTAEELLQFFAKNKERFYPYLLAILLNKLSHLIPNEALPQHKAAILEIIRFSEEFESQLFDTNSISTLFNALAKWPALMAEPLCAQTIDNFLPCIAHRAYSFNGQSISHIFNALSKYPALADLNHSDAFKETINALLAHIPMQTFDVQDALLITLAVCYFTHFKLLDLDSYQTTIITLLKPLDLKHSHLSPFAVTQLQQIFIYAPELIERAMGSWNLGHLTRESFTQRLEHAVPPEKPQSSLLHKEVFRYLKIGFPPKSFGKLFFNEHKIGHTFVDIACPQERLCIQVNGPCHYTGKGEQERLNNKSQFTQHLLEKQGWTVLTIKYDDWQTMTRDKKIAHLREVVGPYLSDTTQQLNQTEQEQTMPSYSVMQQQLAIQQQQLAIQQQQLQIQQQLLAMQQYQQPTPAPVYYPCPPIPPYSAAQPYYPMPYYPAMPMPPHPMQQQYPYPAAAYPTPTTPVCHSARPQPPTAAPPLANTALNYDRHTNLFKPAVIQPTNPENSAAHFSRHDPLPR